jgi:hypothetical protein
MIKLMQCVCRRPHLKIEEFREAWDSFSERLREVALDLGATRVTLSTTLETPLNDALAAARGSTVRFDGVAEIVWPRGAALLSAAALPASRERIASLRVLQDEFADPGRSAYFFVHEQDLLEETESERPL